MIYETLGGKQFIITLSFTHYEDLTMATTADSQSNLSGKIAKICANLRPFQALEYDPAAGMILIITEWLIPSGEVGQISEIIARRKADEKITVRRYDENYKVALIKRLSV